MRLTTISLSYALLFIVLAIFVPEARAASIKMTRRNTGQEHSHLVKRLIADFPEPTKSIRARTSIGTGIGRRGIVKGSYYGGQLLQRDESSSSIFVDVETTSGASSSTLASASDTETRPTSSVITASSSSTSGSVSSWESASESSASSTISSSTSEASSQKTESTTTSSDSTIDSISDSTSASTASLSDASGTDSSSTSSAFVATTISSTSGDTSPSSSTSDSETSGSEASSASSSDTDSLPADETTSGSVSTTDSTSSTATVSSTNTSTATDLASSTTNSESVSESVTFSEIQTAWAQPSDSTASLSGVLSEGDAIVYTIDVTLEDSGVTLPILVDTGSADIWVAGSNCANCTSSSMVDSGISGSDGCEEQEKGYGSGSVSGCLVSANITVGSYNLEDFPILAASDSEGFDGSYMSGIFGLAMNLSSINNQATPMNKLSQLGMISTPEVGFYLARTDSGSELVFGSPHESSHANQDTKVVLSKVTQDDGLYRVMMDAFVSHGYTVTSSDSDISMENIEVILDTGTSDIRVPEDMMLPIYAALGNGTFFTDTTTGEYVVPCDVADDSALALQFGGYQYALQWSDLVANPSTTDANYCYCRVQASPSSISDYLIIGSVFFHNVYHVLNTDTGETTLYELAE